MILAAASNHVPYGHGLVVSTTGTIVAGLILLAVPAVIGYSIRKVRTSVDDMKATSTTNAVAIAKVATQVDKLVVVVAGEEPSLLNPRPAPGLATAIMGQGGLMETVIAHGLTIKHNGEILEAQGKQLAALVASSRILVKDTQNNDGSSTRDAVDRTEASQARIEASQTRLEESLTQDKPA